MLPLEVAKVVFFGNSEILNDSYHLLPYGTKIMKYNIERGCDSMPKILSVDDSAIIRKITAN
ncbi:MAG: hypothetical protein ACM3UZ_02450, partial [Acidobacteriota bacterium]